MIACFGEVMLRLSPQPDSYLIEQASCFTVTPGGSESNVAIALSSLGHRVAMMTVLPANLFGYKVLRYLRGHGVDTNRIIFHKTGRMGLYFTERGSGIRGYRVFYDRENSAYNYAKNHSSSLSQWLKDCSWLHLSGIALATSRNAADFALALTKEAQERGIKISFDINHRKLLWQWCSSKSERSRYLMQVAARSTILVGNETDLETGLFGEPSLRPKEVLKRLTGIAAKGALAWAAISRRESLLADTNNFGGLIYDFQKSHKNPKRYEIKPKIITEIVDRLGTGDAFCGGIIDGFINALGPEKTLKRAIALGILKHGIVGDACPINAHLLERCMQEGSGRIFR